MAVSVFDIFKIGIGPSSSHTVGPMRAANVFVTDLATDPRFDQVSRVRAELFGSLGATGHGHGSESAVLLGLEGEEPATVDTDRTPLRDAEIRSTKRIVLNAAHEVNHEIDFFDESDLVLYRTKSLPFHPNGMTFTAWIGDEVLCERTFYSIGSVAGSSSSTVRTITPRSSRTPVRCPTRSAPAPSCCSSARTIA